MKSLAEVRLRLYKGPNQDHRAHRVIIETSKRIGS
jgi:hypothetical protein